MKTQLFAAGLAVIAISTQIPAAWAEGPRASSGNNWSGMTETAIGEPTAPVFTPAVDPSAAPVPHYVWEQGYGRGGKWEGHWTLVQ